MDTFKETMKIMDEIDSRKDTITSDEINELFKPLAMYLFEHFLDERLYFDPNSYINNSYDEKISQKQRIESLINDLHYCSDRWSPQRLNRILLQI